MASSNALKAPTDSRYAPLTAYLRRVGQPHVAMTFEEIEAVVGHPLPASARRHRAWWSNNPTNSVITWAWLAAGYKSEQVDMEAGRLVFRRDSGNAGKETATEAAPPPFTDRATLLKALYGALKGTVTVPDGTDLTAPTATDWRADR